MFNYLIVLFNLLFSHTNLIITFPLIYKPDTISTKNYEFGITFSPDNNEIFFTSRERYEGNDNRILVLKKENGKWLKPERADFSSDNFEFLPTVTPDGKTLFFYSEKEKPTGVKAPGNIWFCSKTEKGWSKAKFFDENPNIEFCMSISSTLDKTLYFSGKYLNKFGIYRSVLKNGKYSEPVLLPDNINNFRPAHPFIAADESYLIFDAQKQGLGKSEILISYNNFDGTWTNPEKLTKEINQTFTEFAASISPDGKYLFFHRRINENGDIYYVSTDLIFNNKKEK
ncbi:MAG: hypothetical protein RBT46_09535 [Weeksellaceae bacterium]|jgi:Tol biopolymer transport system component|nr:hypothetical protein [Weeksellaceae bacterium]